MAKQELVQVDLVALVEDQVSSNPIVVLHDKAGNRLLPIWIGDPEARAIAVALNKTRTPRPMTHQLLLKMVGGLGGQVLRIVVDRLENNTYLASVYIKKGQKTVAIDARPSDAVALAIYAQVPIFVDKQIMDKAAQPNPVPLASMQQTKGTLSMKEDELQKLKELLAKAREREQKSSGE